MSGVPEQSFRENTIPLHFPRITQGEAAHAPLVREVRLRCWALTRQHDLKPGMWRDFLFDLLCDRDLTFIDSLGRPCEIDLSVFDATDQQIDADEALLVADRLREWFKHCVCKPAPVDAPAFVTAEWHEHFRVLGSIVGAASPNIAVGWPRLPSPAVEAYRKGASQLVVSAKQPNRDDRRRRSPAHAWPQFYSSGLHDNLNGGESR